MRNHTGRIAGAILVAALAGLVASGCTNGAPTAQGQQVIDVLCDRDAALQPLIVPVVVMASPIAGPAAPAVAGAATVDQVMIHPAVVMACAKYHSKPAAVVQSVPPGAEVAAAVTVTAPVAKP
jgi:hypothetical protein